MNELFDLLLMGSEQAFGVHHGPVYICIYRSMIYTQRAAKVLAETMI